MLLLFSALFLFIFVLCSDLIRVEVKLQRVELVLNECLLSESSNLPYLPKCFLHTPVRVFDLVEAHLGGCRCEDDLQGLVYLSVDLRRLIVLQVRVSHLRVLDEAGYLGARLLSDRHTVLQDTDLLLQLRVVKVLVLDHSA